MRGHPCRRLPCLVVAAMVASAVVIGSVAPADCVASPYESDLDYCVAETNQYRALARRPVLVRSALLEAYAATAAPHDVKARKAHKYFRRTNGGGGVAFAENQVPGWPLPQFGSVREIVRAGLALMWEEGQGGGHYDNIVGPYTQVGCGVFVHGDRVTLVQAFR